MISPGEPTSLSGQDLLAEFARGGHEGPFEEIVRRYAGMVYSTCFKVTHDKHEAEDAVQAVFLTLAVQVKRGTEIKSLGPWLQQVARRLSLDVRRSKKRRLRREEQHHDVHIMHRQHLNNTAINAPDVDELKVILNQELEKLPAKYRLPLILHYFGGLSREEMAEQLKCKPSTLGVRVFRGRQMLAERLADRGVSFPEGALACVMGLTAKSGFTAAALNHTAVTASTVAGGHSAALLAERIIGISRRCSAALVLGKVKLALVGIMLLGCSLCAVAKAAGMLPQFNLDRLLLQPLQRLIEPLMSPLSVPMHATLDKELPTLAAEPAVNHTVPLLVFPTPFSISTEESPVAQKSVTHDAADLTTSAPRDFPTQTTTPATHSHVPVTDLALATASTATAAESGDAQTLKTAADAVAASTAGDNFMGAGGGGGGGLGMGGGLAASSDFYLPSSHQTLGTLGLALSDPYAAVLRVPSQSGKILERGGVIRGWGRIARTGTFDVSGKVIADGEGIDRTLDLTSFTAIKCSTQNPRDGLNGWYAVNKGRLDVRLQANARGTIFTWGQAPTDTALTMVNSVRLTLTTDSDPRPTGLSLLALDRDDLPPLLGMLGTPIGIWEVDGNHSITAAHVSIRYDEAAVDALGTSEFGVRLWFFDGQQWTLAPPASFSLDTADHLLSGSGQDFTYFAVTAPGISFPEFSSTLSSAPTTLAALALPAAGVPEPATMLTLMAVGGAALLRRRNNSGDQ